MAKDRIEILTLLASHEITADEASALLDELEPASRSNLFCKVSVKGALSVYGLQRMPVTLYVEQWGRLLAPEAVTMIQDFAKANTTSLKRKAKATA